MKAIVVFMMGSILAPVLYAQTSLRAALPLGTVKDLAEPCDAGPLPNTTCRTVLVSAPDTAPMKAQIRITEPLVGVPVRGTVVYGSGGSGAFFSYDKKPPMMADLQKAGFRQVQRSWESAWARDAGPLAGAGRYATLLTWVHDQVAGSGAFCATGNSNGAAEIGYALGRYGRDEILDLAVPSSGPWTARLDLSCVGWQEECKKLAGAAGSDCPQLRCGAGGMDAGFPGRGNVCSDARRGDKESIEYLLGQSAMPPGARTAYPHTRLHFFYGAADCGQTVPMGLKFASHVTSEKQITVIPGAPHQVYDAPKGNEAIRDEILKNCVKRH